MPRKHKHIDNLCLIFFAVYSSSALLSVVERSSGRVVITLAALATQPGDTTLLGSIWTFHDFDIAAVCAPDAADLFDHICVYPLLDDLD
jgi:hypothetical protein